MRDARYRYIRNFTPDRPFLQSNRYKEESYPVWNLIKELHREGRLSAVQARLAAPTMPEEELYDTEADPHETENLVSSVLPAHQEALRRLRGVLEEWIVATDDKGRVPEPPEVAAAKGSTRPGSNPNASAVRPPGRTER